MRSGLIRLLLALALFFGLADAAAAACNCRDTDLDGYPDEAGSCTASTPATLSYTSGVNGPVPSETISVTLADLDSDGSITCGMYANGDFWVVGEGTPKRGRVTATSPAYSSGNNGWMVDPIKNSNGLDSEIGGFVAPPAFPQDFATAAGPRSFVWSKSATLKDGTPSQLNAYGCFSPTQDTRSCIQFAPVLTFVDSAPTDSHELFRPEIYGAPGDKTVDLRIADIAPRVAALPSLAPPAGASGPSLASIAKHGRWPAIGYHSNQQQKDVQQWGARANYGEEYCSEGPMYGQNLGCTDATVMQRFSLNTFDRSIPAGSDSRKAMVAYVQKSCDALAGVRVGGAWGPPESQQTSKHAWGNIFDGRILKPFVCAYLSGRAAHVATFQARREAGAFFEGGYYNYGPSDAPYQGWSSVETNRCTNAPNNCSIASQESDCLPAAQDRDAGCCTAAKTYPLRASIMRTHQAAAVLLWDRYATAPHDPSSVFDYDRLLKFGLGFGPLATSRAGVIAGAKCSGSGGQLPNGSVPINSSSGHNAFVDAMYATYVGEFEDASLGGDTSTPPPPDPEEPPIEDEIEDPPVVVALRLYDATTQPPVTVQEDWTGGTFASLANHGFDAILLGAPASVAYELDGAPIHVNEVNAPFGCKEGPLSTWIPCDEFAGLAPGSHTVRAFARDAQGVEVPGSARSVTFTISEPVQTVQAPVITVNFPLVTVNCLAPGNRVNFVRARKASSTLASQTLPSTPSVQTFVFDLLPHRALIAGPASAQQGDNLIATCRLGPSGAIMQSPEPFPINFVAEFAAFDAANASVPPTLTTDGLPLELRYTFPANHQSCTLQIKDGETTIPGGTFTESPGSPTEDTPRAIPLDLELLTELDTADAITGSCVRNGVTSSTATLSGIDFAALLAALPQPEPTIQDLLDAIEAQQLTCEAPVVNPTPVTCPELPEPVCEAPVVNVDLAPVTAAIAAIPAPVVNVEPTPVTCEAPIVNPTPVTIDLQPVLDAIEDVEAICPTTNLQPVLDAIDAIPATDLQPILDAIDALVIPEGMTPEQIKQALKDVLEETTLQRTEQFEFDTP